jgi:hypothetical protein
MMVEVFKTNVTDRDRANWLIDKIQNSFDNYSASFDLEDCDRILVVKCSNGNVQTSLVIDLLRSFGYDGDVLPDE